MPWGCGVSLFLTKKAGDFTASDDNTRTAEKGQEGPRRRLPASALCPVPRGGSPGKAGGGSPTRDTRRPLQDPCTEAEALHTRCEQRGQGCGSLLPLPLGEEPSSPMKENSTAQGLSLSENPSASCFTGRDQQTQTAEPMPCLTDRARFPVLGASCVRKSGERALSSGWGEADRSVGAGGRPACTLTVLSVSVHVCVPVHKHTPMCACVGMRTILFSLMPSNPGLARRLHSGRPLNVLLGQTHCRTPALWRGSGGGTWAIPSLSPVPTFQPREAVLSV